MSARNKAYMRKCRKVGTRQRERERIKVSREKERER